MKVITYGTFDVFHYGHLRLLERARALGDCLVVGVTTEQFDRGRGKTGVRQPLQERMRRVRETGLADLVIPEAYPGQKKEDILRLGIDIFTAGSDWTGRFDDLRRFCAVIYLSRTDGISSTQIRRRRESRHRALRCYMRGLIGKPAG